MSALSLVNGVVLNLAVLIAGVFLVSLTFFRVGQPDRPAALLARYVALVATSLFALANTVQLVPGILFDFRMVPVALVARRHGRLAGLAVALPVGTCRFLLGGVGAVPSLLQLLLVAWLAAPDGAWLRLTASERTALTRTPWVALRLFALANLPLFIAFALGREPWTTAVGAYTALTVLSTVGLLLGQVAGNTRLRSLARTQHYQTLASTDALTGVLNRRQFEQDLAAVPDDTYLLLLDLDHFKRVNDTYGHDGGDRVLQAFTAITQHSTRARDRVYRLGGEEFAVLLHHCPPETAADVAERIRANVQGTLAARAGLPGETFTVSGGLVLVAPEVDALAVADERLYRAKAHGRNRTVTA
ncbi:diguanylate cyclase (plasmid) [Deinococcus taeanensis]|uniref:GGDEF domain-containing protein n=1 Tax=Deinococcus taeanensis TaxID=2737050 RepID=UPI001CDC693F|nr:diguanylate cyclase [Deinococcus taeanensis]UBV44467.1 diguanylate cyclase [Deinococcus taeanensis]